MKKNKLVGVILALIVIPIGGYGIYYSYNNYFNTQPQVASGSSSLSSSSSSIANNGTTLSAKEIANYEKSELANENESISSIEHSIIANYNKAKSMSPYVAGWIYIQGTDVDYPVMAGKSSNYWLNYNWLGEKSISGSIFLDERELSLDNEVSFINGHNMSSSAYTSDKPFCGGTRFAQVRYFLEMPGFFQDADKHKIFIYDGQSMKIYQVFSTYIVSQDYQVEVNFQNMQEVREYGESLRVKSSITPPKYNGSNLLILNTCYVDKQQQHIITVAQEVK